MPHSGPLAGRREEDAEKVEMEEIVSRNPRVLNGDLVFAATRVPVKNLVDYLAAGDTLEEFLDDFPSVTREQALAALSPVLGSFSNVRELLVNADIGWPTITVDGKPQRLSDTGFAALREHPDRAVRKQAFDTFWKVYAQHENTLGALLAQRVDQGVIAADGTPEEAAEAYREVNRGAAPRPKPGPAPPVSKRALKAERSALVGDDVGRLVRLAAAMAPATVSPGALSPPRASTARRNAPSGGLRLLRRLYGDGRAALVEAAVRADAVREVGLPAVRTGLQARALERVVRAAKVPASLGRLLLRYRHVATSALSYNAVPPAVEASCAQIRNRLARRIAAGRSRI